MNKTIETIMNRRSVRHFQDKAIPQDKLETIIEAGNVAPTGSNAQNWRFVVVQNDDFKNKLRDIAIPRYQRWMENAPQQLVEMRKEIDANTSDPIYYNAPVIVFVIGAGNTKNMDTPMVCENMMIAARSLGIGSCWVYFGQLPINDSEIHEALGLHDAESVYGPILLGYPQDGFPEAPSKKEPEIKWI